MGRFDGIIIEEDDIAIVGRNSEMRVLFRYNVVSCDYGVFRSPRMTETEIDLIIIQFKRLFMDKMSSSDINKRKTEMLAFLNYQTDQETFCS